MSTILAVKLAPLSSTPRISLTLVSSAWLSCWTTSPADPSSANSIENGGFRSPGNMVSNLLTNLVATESCVSSAAICVWTLIGPISSLT